MGGGGIEKMVAVGLVWGATNALMRKGALVWEHRQSQLRRSHHRGLLGTAREWAALLLVWQYTLPFLLNLSASAAFFVALGSSPISLAVPVTNAVTFASTALFAALLGEPTRLSPVLLGTSLVALGVWLCIDSSKPHVPS
ncbi:Transmembrane 234 protein [Nymphaea thermarum]|nr:Transmembrane 234 protein [Nymphaea thermarum]